MSWQPTNPFVGTACANPSGSLLQHSFVELALLQHCSALIALAKNTVFAAPPLQVTDLRTKARLLVPQGTLLVGVMDEFGVLQEGEVFVQVRARCLCRCAVVLQAGSRTEPASQ